MQHFLVTFLLAGTLIGCAGAPQRDPAAFIAPELRFSLPSPAELGYRVDATQLVTAHYRGDTQVFEAHVSVSPERVTLIGLDPFGRRALTVTLSDGGIAVERAPWLPDALRPENILADVAIVYWPPDAVRRGLSRSDAVLRDDGKGRSIIAGGREVVHVDYGPRHAGSWAATAHYRNIAFGYELDLRSAVESP